MAAAAEGSGSGARCGTTGLMRTFAALYTDRVSRETIAERRLKKAVLVEGGRGMIRMFCAALALASVTAAETGFKPLFNGRDLDGWEIDTPGIWRVRDGMVVGKHDGLKYNDFLRTKKHYRDFELRLKFRMLDGERNSGVQFRSLPVPDSHEVAGYQADIGMQYWGCLYDESRRKRVLAQARSGSLEGLDRTGWNEYRITARGNRITLELNGKLTVDYTETEPGMDAPGFIALQVHSGPNIEVWFKDMMIRELP